MSSISDAQALSILHHAQESRYNAQSNADVAAKGAQVGSKLEQAKATMKQTTAEQQSTLIKFAGSAAGMGLNYKLMLKAQNMQMGAGASSKQAAAGAGLNAAAQGNGIGGVMDKGVDAIDQNMGAAAKANEAKIEGKFADMQGTVAEQQAEQSKAAKEAALKGLDGVNELAKGFFERAKQVVDKAFGG